MDHKPKEQNIDKTANQHKTGIITYVVKLLTSSPMAWHSACRWQPVKITLQNHGIVN
jgi:hypothetical protein